MSRAVHAAKRQIGVHLNMNPEPEVPERIPRDVARKLGYYVYVYFDPRTKKPFYVGKGVGQRALAHLSSVVESRKREVIEELRREKRSPNIEILAHGLDSEETARRLEAAVIDLFGLGELTNLVRGSRAIQLGRMSLRQLINLYGATEVKIVDPVILIRINRLFRPNMSEDELYEATRGVWKIGARRNSAKFACAVFEGVVQEVFEIAQWHQAGSTPYSTRVHEKVNRPGRWEFTGSVAPEPFRSRYKDRRVESYFPRGLQSPVVYVNAEG